MATMEKKEVCPRCYSETGQSIVLKRDGEVYKCPRNPNHKFKKEGEHGFLKKIE